MNGTYWWGKTILSFVFTVGVVGELSPLLPKIDNPPLPDIEVSFIFPTGMTPKGGLCTVAMTTTSIDVNEKQL